MNKVLLGSHVRMTGPEYFLGSVKEAISYNATALMFYTGAPQNSARVPLERCKIEEASILLNENGFNKSQIICHAPYLINLGNIIKKENYDMSLKMLINEMTRAEAFGAGVIVLHPGSSLGEDKNAVIEQIVLGINTAISKTKNIKIAIETMAGKGNEVCSNFQDIGYIISKIENKDRIGVCLDSCHIHDAGYDLNHYEDVIHSIDSSFGIDKVLVIHLNDSKNLINSHKDRHENIGFGDIGFDILHKILFDERFIDIPKILETPYFSDKPPYKDEIEMLLSGNFDKDLFKNY
ncbi:MAG: deoxyribonuclease IV [Bacilli bacterium]